MRCAFLTMDDTEGWSIDAGLCIPHLETLGWQVDWIPWRRPDVNWDSYDLVYTAAPWDYPDNAVEFMQVIEAVAGSTAALVNPAELVRWNVAKTYLRDLQSRGIAIVPSQWYERFVQQDLPAWFERAASKKIIAKPLISANAANTFLLEAPVDAATLHKLETVFAERAFMVQPFIENIRSEGEFSLFYIDGELSHAIQKIPKSGDFRVQEEHGASIARAKPGVNLRAAADAVMRLVEPPPVYARVDLVRSAGDQFLLMELELIEPSMYLRMDESAARRFASALNGYIAQTRTG
jgi:glutathione synthase/RimK-type ligase-like ATP-grasp enzyme